MNALRRAMTASLVAMLGCGPQVSLEGGDTSGAATSTGMSPPPVTSAVTSTPGETTLPPVDTSTSATTGGGDTTGAAFITMTEWICGELPDGTKAHCTRCDLWAQDCPVGEKCTAWANDGSDVFDATICVPVPRMPLGIGDACTTEGGPATGHDECDRGSICLFHDADGIGECVPFCGGSQDVPSCDGGLQCVIELDGALSICVPPCDPLVDDCAPGHCSSTGDTFSCFPALPPAAALGEACEHQSQCPDGSACIPAEQVPGCPAGAGCCAPLCDVTVPMPDAACAAGLSCVSWWTPPAPPELAHVGVCAP